MRAAPAWVSQEASRERALDADLVRLVDAAMAGDRSGALRALADAQLHGLVEHRGSALAWVSEQVVLVGLLPDGVADAVEGERLLAEALRAVG